MEAILAELAPVTLAEGQKLKVVATTNIIGDLVSNVGSDLIELTSLLPIGSDSHTFSPTPQDVAVVADAHVVFVVGLNLEEFLAELIENAGGEVVVIPLSAGVATRELEEMGGDHHGDEAGEEREHEEEEAKGEAGEMKEEEAHEEEGHGHEAEAAEHQHGGKDPHVWMTPTNAIVMVHSIEATLSALDPANAERYKANAEAYAVQLAELDEWVKTQIATIPAENREIVTDHDSFGYYADRYGLELVGAVIPNFSTNAEPSAQELAELQNAIVEYDVKAIFVGTTISSALAERVAEDTGIQLVSLYTESLGGAGSSAETYLDYIRYNTNAIVEALK
jgi:ABC-type Zn uptake system ZnuABC Zn-binding protein ZnuA